MDKSSIESDGCGSGVEPASCFWKVNGSIPLQVEVSLDEILNP